MPDPISWAHTGPYLLLFAAIGYLCGSIPFGVLITKFAGTADLRTIGSGNIGATNVLRTGRKDLAAMTLAGDFLKSLVPTFLAGQFYGPDAAVVTGFSAFIGHLYPVWLKFKGGKGVATYGGVMGGLWWPIMLIGFGTWLLVAFVTRYSSLSALTAAIVAPIVAAAFWQWQMAEVLALMSVFVFWKHRDNIRRLIKGEETKIGQKKS